MRATASISPARTGKQRLLASCAIAAGLSALAFGGPSRAQVLGSGEVVIGTGLGTATIDNAPVGKPNTTQVVANGNQTVINWTPSGTAPAGSPIEFLATGNTLEYYGTGDYTVLNRFVARDGAGNPIPLNQQIAINGNVNSYVGTPAAGSSAPQGGNIWFYNAGGILIGTNAVLNVGSLVLTANDIDFNDGLFGSGGEIRFRGAPGSTAAIEIAPRSFINAMKPGNPGSSYVALVAPRIVQSGAISSDGSSALVAAEQADITINNGLFDINVTVGAEGGNAITHSGITGGPAHQEGDTDQSRVYMVAIPKNDAVTMLISGQIGYQDALSAQTEPDGSVRLAAGYNIVGGEIAAAPVNTTAANIVANDVLFASNVVAHASGDFTGGAVQQLPPPVLPSAPPPGQGRFFVEGNGTFIGDRSATVSIGTNQSGGAFGNFTLQSNGSGAAAGSATLNVDDGGTFRVGLPSSPGGNLSILAGGRPDATTGDSRGGTATLSIAGGDVQAVGVAVAATATGGLASDGSGGGGFGGTANIAVSGIGGTLTADVIDVSASGRGGGVTIDSMSNIIIADRGGNGTGGSAGIVASGGGSITANASVTVNASGAGQIGNVQSGNGQGGTARIEVADAGTYFSAPTTTIIAGGIGGSPLQIDIGTFLSAAGGNGTGGTVELVLSGDQTTTALLGNATLNAAGTGGSANGDGSAGGDAQGGNATISADGGLSASLNSLTVNVRATSGGATSSNGTSSRTGDATGGDIDITANGGAALTSSGSIILDASATAAAGENRGNAQGGTVRVAAVGSGGDSRITTLGEFRVDAGAGGFSFAIPASTGSATGGDIDFTADGGTITADFFSVDANAASDNSTGLGGAAQGGTIDLRAANTGTISSTGTSNISRFETNAGAGVSQGGSPATGGRIGVVVDGGTLTFGTRAFFEATGIAGGDQSAAGNLVAGRGGSILFQSLDNNLNPSTINFTDIFANADGRAQAPFEGAGFLRGTAAGYGGDVTFDVQGGQLTGNSIQLSASGFGSETGDSDGLGSGGLAAYSQTGGVVNLSNLAVSADGSGGSGLGGMGMGGTATITLASGALTASDITAEAVGRGGFGDPGTDSDPANAVDGEDGGFGQGGTATITLDGDAVVTTTTLSAFASGLGGGGGDYFSGNGIAGNAGNGGGALGGTATITLTAGSLTATDITTDAGGVGGNGGQFFDFSSSSSPAAGRGGNGGNGQGGTATIGLATTITTTGDIGSLATGRGGDGGAGNIAGDGGEARGGTAELVITDISASTGGVVLDARADGGAGGSAMNGAGGRGGYAEGGTARVRAEGTGAYARVTDANFITTGTGGNGGSGGLFGGNGPLIGPRGGDGGDGRGGTVELVANDGTIEVAIGSSGVAGLRSGGIGGDGGNGSGNPGSITLPGPDGIPGTPDDIVQGRIGGDGGIGGSGNGGTVRLTANGGTITSGGNSVAIVANGTSGNGGNGGDGSGGIGAGGGSFGTQGGTVVLESRNSASNRGRINLGDTVIDASGDTAGRVELIADGSITMPSLTVTAAGFAVLTNNDTDLAPAGIFLGINDGGLIQTDGAVSLTTGSSVGVYAQGTGQFNVGGTLDVTADDQVDIRHDFRAGTAPTIQTGGSASFTAANSIRSAPGSLVSAGTSLTMTVTGLNSAIDVDSLDAGGSTLLRADGGRINVYGTTRSGDDLVASARDETAIANAIAGDDINLQGGTIVAGRLITDGTGLDSELDGSNIVIGTVGAAGVDHAEADNDFVADAGSFATGPNSIITGGDIDITAVGAVDLGNSSAGGFVSVNGQSIVFDTITAGTTVGLNATGTAPGAEGILGNGIDAGGNVTLVGNSIRINDGVVTSASLFAGATGGNASLSATTDGDITVNATGDIGGAFAAQGNITLTADGNVTAQAATSGGYVGPNGVSEGYVFVNAGGTANLLTGSGAATMVGVRAGTNATVAGTTAGEDLYVLAGNTATVTNSVAGDDMIVAGTCCVIVDTVSTTGAGPDGRSLIFGPFSSGGPDMWQIQTSPADLSSIALTASAGTIDAADANAFDNLTATASDVVRSTGTLRSGLVTTITGSALDLESVTAGTDILLTSTSGGITATGALSAGHDLTITSAADGNFADLAAGDDIRIAANGNVTAASLLTTAGGLDNESDNSGAYVDTPGSIAITGATSTVGQTRLTAGGTVDTGAITADYSFIDAGGAVNVTGDIASGGMFIEGSNVALMNADGNSGQIVLRATGGDVTADGDVTTLASVEVQATGAIGVSGETRGGNFVEMTGGSISVDDVSSNTYVALTATSGAINSTGTIDAGTDVILDAAGGGQFNALVAGDDIVLGAGGNVTIASMRADGSNPQGEEIGSNVRGTVAGALTVTGDIFSADDVVFDATSIALRNVQAGGSLTATATGGPVSIASADTAGNIGVSAAGDITGSYAAGGDIALSAGGDIAASANAAGGFVDLSNGDVETAGHVFVDASGDVTLTDSSAAGTLGVNAGGAATLTNASAGEDMLVLAATTADLSEITVGDDLDVRAAGAITATGVSATGEGLDGFALVYGASGFTIGQGEGVSSLDGADIDLRSSGGSITATGLSAGDDIVLDAATTLAVSGATTLGLGQTGGDSSIRTQSGNATLDGLDAFDDIIVGSSGTVAVTAPVRAGRDATIGAAAITTATLGEPNGDPVDAIVAGRDLAVTASGDIDAGAVRAGRDLSLTAGTTLAVRRAATGAGGTLALDGADGLTAGFVAGGGATSLTSDGGAILVDGLSSAGPVAARGDSITIAGGSGNLVFSALDAAVGDASVTSTGDLSVTAANVAGRATLRSTNGDLAVTQLAAADAQLGADDALTLGDVTATNGLLGEAGGTLAVNGVVTARDISLGSGDIAIASNGRVGTTGTTRTLDLRNTNGRAQTFVGGTGTRSGYHLDAAEMTRLYGTDIGIFAPQVDNNNGGFVAAAPGGLPIGSVGSSSQPDVIIDDFTMTAGGSGSNLGTSGTLTIETPGKARVVGDVLFTGMSDTNGLTIRARDALEVILGEGSIRLTGASSSGTTTPAGLLTLVSADVIVATASVIADVAAAADTDAIDDRLAQNDGITSDDGALYAGGIDVGVEGGFYVQNSGAGTRFAERRGLTFGAQGLNVTTAGTDTRIVVNGVHLGASGPVTGLDAIAQLSINGTAVGSAPSTGGSFDPRSTMNGCLIVSSGACAFQEFETSFPVQDLIEEEDKESAGKNGEGQGLPTPLITMRDLDPLTGEPLVDDPVTGAGNDDLWSPPSE
ncbi:hypothetical protein EAO27_12460 [Sphingopyxis sp. YF1]|uniref:hypothetical protein n=1 Tax=Sphingopyxis sp. YF1 TaxID=2482763 RepID=UPI001F6222BC|nr:hypothetical protein [Sphingopyxis sp. YF1]UNU43436.1 hypothetical protein EAO27_12460 [Sphingopyxis sp. YF1]